MRRFLAIAVISTALAALAASRPAWNFDAIGYAGVARQWLGESGASLQSHVYGELDRVAPARWAQDIRGGSAYRKSVANDPAKFAVQLRFYTNKPLYVGLVALLCALGANSVSATFWVSAIAFGVLGALLLDWLTRLRSGVVPWLVGVCLSLFAPVLEVGRLATPDALAAALNFAGLHALLGRQRPLAGLVLLVSAQAARPDSIVLLGPVLAWLAMSRPPARRAALVTAGLSLVTNAALSAATRAFPWSALFVHTFVRRIATLDDAMAAGVDAMTYLKVLGRGLTGGFIMYPPSLPLFVIPSILMSVSVLRGQPRFSEWVRLLHALWLSAALHVLAFPMLADRFFVVLYLFICVCGTAMTSTRDEATP